VGPGSHIGGGARESGRESNSSEEREGKKIERTQVVAMASGKAGEKAGRVPDGVKKMGPKDHSRRKVPQKSNQKERKIHLVTAGGGA